MLAHLAFDRRHDGAQPGSLSCRAPSSRQSAQAFPPLSGGVVTYGLAALGEVIVWVRVRQRLDRWAELGMAAVERAR